MYLKVSISLRLICFYGVGKFEVRLVRNLMEMLTQISRDYSELVFSFYSIDQWYDNLHICLTYQPQQTFPSLTFNNDWKGRSHVNNLVNFTKSTDLYTHYPDPNIKYSLPSRYLSDAFLALPPALTFPALKGNHSSITTHHNCFAQY